MRYYLIGIKGVGMTALAQILKSNGHFVTGSDGKEKFFTDQILRDLKIDFKESFNAKNLDNSYDFVVKSSAYDESNPEVKKAYDLGLIVLDYPEALGEISKEYFSIAVSGTHGKTTQTAMLSQILIDLKLDPQCIVGSAVPKFHNRNARTQIKKNPLFVAEVCEYKRNFLNFCPSAVLIPSLDYDHIDYYKTPEDYINAFVEFSDKLPKNGKIIVCGDLVPDKFLKNVRKDIQIETYGFDKSNDYVITKPVIKDEMLLSTFDSNEVLSLKIPGSHNILNAYGALLMAKYIASILKKKFDLEKALKSLLNFKNTKRRFERKGILNKALLFDDYAHHPAEIETTLKAAKAFYPTRKITVIFQSHTFSRTEEFRTDFAKSLKNADLVILAPIYGSAREKQSSYTSENFFSDILKENKSAVYLKDMKEIAKLIKKTASKEDLIITMGAGDIFQVHDLLKKS